LSIEPWRVASSDLTHRMIRLAHPGSRPPSPPAPASRRGLVEFAGDRAALVAALRRGEEGAAAALFHEYGSLVERTVGRILGVDADLPDVTQDVFFRALRSMHRVRDPQALTEWLLQIAVYTATDWIRKRKRLRWLVFFDPAEVPATQSSSIDEAGRDALRATYRVLDRMGVEERTAFALRHIDGMELKQVATACDCSLATIKRRLGRANEEFRSFAKNEPALLPWLAEIDETSDPEELP
jgi:RNA polymerase sigma-70 factor (ECF subfamily)